MRGAIMALVLAVGLAGCATTGQTAGDRESPPEGRGGYPLKVQNDHQDPVTVYALPSRARLGRVRPMATKWLEVPTALSSRRTHIAVCFGSRLREQGSRCVATENAIDPQQNDWERLRVDISRGLYVELIPF